MPAALHVHVRDDLLDVLYYAVLHVVAVLVVVCAAVPLVAHLRDDAVLLLGRHQKLALAERMRKGLLDVDRLPKTHRVHRRAEVRVVGNADEDGVDLALHLVEHLAEVLEARKIREALQRLFRVGRSDVGVAERDDFADVLVPRELLEVEPRLRSAADRRKAHLAVRDIRLGREAPGQKRIREAPGQKRISTRRKHRGQETTPINVHLVSPFTFQTSTPGPRRRERS